MLSKQQFYAKQHVHAATCLFYTLLAGGMQMWHLHLPAWACEQASLAPSRHNSPTFSSASCAALNRLERCWFIFARGATPSATSKTEG